MMVSEVNEMDRRRIAPETPIFLECLDCGKRFMSPQYTSRFIRWTPCCPGCGGTKVEPLTMASARKLVRKLFHKNKDE